MNYKSGRYFVNGRPAWVTIEKDGSARVQYDDGSFTAAFAETFAKWNVQKIQQEIRA